jgi:hypothetical protein
MRSIEGEGDREARSWWSEATRSPSPSTLRVIDHRVKPGGRLSPAPAGEVFPYLPRNLGLRFSANAATASA